jgi:Uma2 family endonuclease
MASAIRVPPITFEQYELFESPNGYRDELINGRIVVSPEAKPLHSQVAENIYELLRKASDKRKYKVSQRMNLRFPDVHSMPSPDVFVIELQEWRRACAESRYPDDIRVLLAVEVMSPSNYPRPLNEKINIYVQHGLEAWVVDSRKGEVKVHRRGQPSRTVSSKQKSPALQWCAKPISLAKIFGLP